MSLEALQIPSLWLPVADAIVKSTLLLALAVLVTRALRHRSAASRHLVWTCALVAALALPLLSIVVPRWQVPLLTVPSPAAAPTLALSHDDASVRMAAMLQTRLAEQANVRGAERAGAVTLPVISANVSWTLVLFLIWASGAFVMLARLILGTAAVHVLSRRTASAENASWMPLAQELASTMGIARVSFRRSDASAIPMAWGIVRPVVLIPAEADTWPDERIRMVLLHELAHVKRADCLTHMLAQVSCALHWLNPLAWIAARHVRTERERACDDLVLAFGTPETDYADQLLELARTMRAGRFSSTVATASLAMAHRSQLEGRLMAILDPSIPRSGISRVRTIAASAVAFMLMAPLASVQPWAYAADTVTVTAQPPAPPAPPPAAPVAAPEPAPALPAPPSVEPPPAPPAPDRGPRFEREQQAAPNPRPRLNIGDSRERKKVDPKLIAALTQAMKDTDKGVREAAMQALISLRDPGMVEPLIEALKDSSSDVREHAAFGLGQLHDKRAIAPLTALLKDANAGVREQAVFALGQFRDAGTFEAMATALRDESASVREQAVFALGQIGDQRALDALTGMLKDASPRVREQAAFAIGQLAR